MTDTEGANPLTLHSTLDQARDRAVSYIGTRGIPNDWWPSTYGQSWEKNNDCIKAVLFWLGVATRDQQDHRYISIEGFRASSGWNEVAAEDIRPGHIACEVWDEDDKRAGIPDHAELIYSYDPKTDLVTTVSANTSPAPGVPITEDNRGVYKKTRKLGDWLLLAVKPPYASPVTGATAKDRANVRLVAGYLNKTRALDLPVTKAEDDGYRGPIYWLLVQWWGRHHDEYGPSYKIDGIPGPRSRAVEALILAKAKAAKR